MDITPFNEKNTENFKLFSEVPEVSLIMMNPGGDFWKPRCVEAPRVSWELMKLAEALCSGQWSMALPTALWTGLLASTFLDL